MSISLPAHAAEVVHGRAVPGTAGVSGSEMEAFLVVLDADRNERSRLSTRVDGDGKFEFTGVDVPEGGVALAGVVFEGVTYTTLVEKQAAVTVTYYAATDEDAHVGVESDTLTIVKGEDDVLEVLQVLRVRNTSDRTFIGREMESSRVVVELPLPQGAFELSAGEGISRSSLVETPLGVATTEPLLPGETSFTYLYKVRVGRSGWSMQRPVLYPTKHADLLIGEGLDLVEGAFELQETKSLGGKIYRRFRGGPFSPGAALGATVGYSSGDAGTATGFLIFASIAVAALAGVALFLKKRPVAPVPSRPSEREQLIERIASLDISFERGEIDERTYTEQRREMKRQLLQQSGQLSSR